MSAAIDTMLELAEAERSATTQHTAHEPWSAAECAACVAESLLARLRKALEERDAARAAVARRPADPAMLEVYRRALWSVLSTEVRRKGKGSRAAFWSRVGALCGLGSTSADRLCRDLGFDPAKGATVRERGWEPAP